MNSTGHARVVGIAESYGGVARLAVLPVVVAIGAIPKVRARTRAHTVVAFQVGVRIAVGDVEAPAAVRGRGQARMTRAVEVVVVAAYTIRERCLTCVHARGCVPVGRWW